MINKVCNKCKKEQSLSNFPNHSNTRDRKRSFCKKCYYESTRKSSFKYREKNRVLIDDYLKNHSCVDCGESDYEVLDFDHIRGAKLNNVSEMLSYSQEKLIIEISKCEVVCANCHRRRTNRRPNLGRPRKW
jgi:hypothetical protein